MPIESSTIEPMPEPARSPEIRTLTAEEAEVSLGPLCDLLTDAVESGGSVGFLLPITHAKAESYWYDVIAAVRDGRRVLLASFDDHGICGSVQVDLETRENGNHRCELMKLFVHRRARRRGMARLLVAHAELEAVKHHRTLLLMDTRKGSDAEKLCVSMGYKRVGEVPNYARSTDGTLHSTVLYYREIRQG